MRDKGFVHNAGVRARARTMKRRLAGKERQGPCERNRCSAVHWVNVRKARQKGLGRRRGSTGGRVTLAAEDRKDLCGVDIRGEHPHDFKAGKGIWRRRSTKCWVQVCVRGVVEGSIGNINPKGVLKREVVFFIWWRCCRRLENCVRGRGGEIELAPDQMGGIGPTRRCLGGADF